MHVGSCEATGFWRSVIAPVRSRDENRNEIVSWAKMPAKEPGAGFNGQDYVTYSGGPVGDLPHTEHTAEAWRC